MDLESAAEPEASAPPVLPAAAVARHRRWWLMVALLSVLVLGLAITLVVVRSHDGRPHAEVGQIFDAPFREDPLPHRGQVLLPWARTQVGAGRVRDELPDLLGARANVRAPDGGSFVKVEVELEEDFAIPLSAVGAPYAEETEVVLRADGRDYPLSGPGGLVLDPNGPFQQGGGRWVAVEGEPTDLEVRVTVDGVTQVVDAADGSVEAGQAADLAALPTTEELRNARARPCGRPRRLDDSGITVSYRPALKCRVQLALRMPYVDGLGWAASGREFLVVHVVRPRRLSLVRESGGESIYWDADLAFTARLGEAEPSGPLVDVNGLNQGQLSIQDPDSPDQVVFDVAKGERLADLTLELAGEATTGEPFVKDRRRLGFRWTVPGGELG